jgi:hypothetical protein
MKLAGVIYLCDISQARGVSNSEPLWKFLGTVRNVVVATTKWGDVVKDVGFKREEQLSSKWQLNQARFDNSAESGWRIVDQILKNKPDDPLELLESLIKILEFKEPKVRSLNPFGKFLNKVRKMFG